MSQPFCSLASERNKHPILNVLRPRLQSGQSILEIGSGTGQHVVHFAHALPDVRWLPTELPSSIDVLRDRVEKANLPNIDPPRILDVASAWPSLCVDGVYSANTAHIMGWREVQCMFRGVGFLLQSGRFYLYGPFNRQGQFTSEGNQAFDRSLRQQDPQMGLRDDEDLMTLGEQWGLTLEEDLDLPSNNRLLVWNRTPAFP